MSVGPKVKCKLCNDIIQSMHVHDYVWCKCHTIAVDGGGEYLKMCWNSDKGTLDELREIIEDEN